MGNSILSNMMSGLPNPELDIMAGGILPVAPTTITETPAAETTETAATPDYSSLISGLRGISSGGYIPDADYRNYTLGMDQTKKNELGQFLTSLYSQAGPRLFTPGVINTDDGYFINSEYNPFRSPAEWSKDLASNLAYQNTMGESTSSGWGHDLVRNTLRVAGDVIPAAFGAVVGNVPGAIIGALGTGLKKGGDVAGAGGSPGDALKTGLSSAAIAALASYAGSAVSGALSGAADVGGALDQGWSSTGMPTEGMLSSAPQGNILSNLAGTLAKTGTKTGLSTLLSQLFGTDAQNIISNTGTTATTEAAAAEPTSIADAMTSSATSTTTSTNSGSAMLKYLSEMASAMGGGNIGRLKKSAGII